MEHAAGKVEHRLVLYFKEKLADPDQKQSVARHPVLVARHPVLIARHPVLAELDDKPTESELFDAVSSLPCGKAISKDRVLTEVLKDNINTFLPHLYKLHIQPGPNTL